MKDFRSLLVWQKAHACVLEVYRVTAVFPPRERYNLTSQLRRAATSVPSNLAEGCGRRTDADVARFVQIALGSASEVEYQLLLSADLGYLDRAVYRTLSGQVVEVKKMLSGYLRRLRSTADR